MKKKPASQVVVLKPGQGRTYEMGGMTAVFKADEAETGHQYSISEWWLEPHTQGPGMHAHEEDDVFYVLDGVMSFYIDEKWIDAPKGSFVIAPGGTEHDFQNRTDVRAGALNLSIPGGFEENMPDIVKWFRQAPPGRAD